MQELWVQDILRDPHCGSTPELSIGGDLSLCRLAAHFLLSTPSNKGLRPYLSSLQIPMLSELWVQGSLGCRPQSLLWRSSQSVGETNDQNSVWQVLEDQGLTRVAGALPQLAGHRKASERTQRRLSCVFSDMRFIRCSKNIDGHLFIHSYSKTKAFIPL